MSTNLVENLMTEVEALIRDLQRDPAGQWMLDGRVSREEYAAFLQETYHYVCWTRPLLARSAARITAAGRSPALASLFARKAEEETGHERWALADLAALGWDTRVVQRSSPGVAAQAYIAWNRLCVEVGAPEAFLGTAFVLEALSTRFAGQIADQLVVHSGIPGIGQAVSFLRGHAAADEDHVKHLGEILGAIADRSLQEAIVLSARTTRVTYALLVGIARRVEWSTLKCEPQ